MRQGQSKRIRGRSRGGGNNSGGGGGGKGPNPLSRSYESNGPDVKIRGTAGTIADKYVQLSRDALTSGDPVGAENYMQHAEHYYRLLAAAQAQYQPHQTVVRADADDFNDVEFDDEGNEQADAGGQQAGQNGAPQPQQGGQPNGQPYQARQPNGGRQNGPYGQQPPRDDQQRRYDRNDRRSENRYDRQDGNRQEAGRQDPNRQPAARPDNRYDAARGDERRPERDDRPERAPRANGGDEQPAVGELPAFITGGAPSVSPEPAPRPALEPKRAATVAPDPADETPSPALAAPEGAASDGDPRDEGGAVPARSRRRRYGRFGRGPASEEGGEGAPQPEPETSSD